MIDIMHSLYIGFNKVFLMLFYPIGWMIHFLYADLTVYMWLFIIWVLLIIILSTNTVSKK